MNNITKDMLAKYRDISVRALKIAKESISPGKKIEAKEIITMVEAYLSDSKHFEIKGDLVNAFGAIYYAHGWLDCGARLKIFDVSDDKLFTIWTNNETHKHHKHKWSEKAYRKVESIYL